MPPFGMPSLGMTSSRSTSLGRQNAGSEEGSSSTEKALDYGARKPRSNAVPDHPGSAAPLCQFPLPRTPSRKRPADNYPQSEAKKCHKTSLNCTPQTSPGTKQNTANGQTDRRERTRVTIDLTVDSDTPSLPRPPFEPAQYTLASPPRKIIRPVRPNRPLPHTDPGPAVNKKLTFVDLTGDDDPISSPARRSNESRLLIDLTIGDVSPSPAAHRSTKAHLGDDVTHDGPTRSSAYQHNITPKGLTQADSSTDSSISSTDGSAVAGQQVKTSHGGRRRPPRAPHRGDSSDMQTPAIGASGTSPGGTSPSEQSSSGLSDLLAKWEKLPESTPVPQIGTLQRQDAPIRIHGDEASKPVHDVTNAQPVPTESHARTPPVTQDALAQINRRFYVALDAVRSAPKARAPNLATALGQDSQNPPGWAAPSRQNGAPGTRSSSQGHEGARGDRDEASPFLGTRWLPGPAPRGHADPLLPSQGAHHDESVATDANNADGGPEETRHSAETDAVPEPKDTELLAEVAQMRDLGISSDGEHAAGDGGGSDGEYIPATLSRRFRRRASARKTSLRRASRTPRHSRIVTLRAPPEQLRQISLRPRHLAEMPIGDKCFLARLPLEVRKLIYRHLLLASGPIQVMKGWSQLRKWQKLDLYPTVLSVSRPVFDEAVRVLYGENEFRYLVRDKADMLEFGGGRDGTGLCAIDVRKYGRYFRSLELRVERNRMTDEYDGVLARALGILRDSGAELYRLTIDVSPRVEEDESVSMTEWFDQDGAVNLALKALDAYFIHVHVFTPDTDTEEPRALRCVIDRRREVSDLEVTQIGDRHGGGGGGGGGGPRPSGEETSRLIRAEQARRADGQLDQLSVRISVACRDPARAVRQGWFEPFEATRERRREMLTDQPLAYAGGEASDNPDDEDYNGE